MQVYGELQYHIHRSKGSSHRRLPSLRSPLGWVDEDTDGTRHGSFTLRGTTGSQNGRPRLELSEYIESYGRRVT